MESETLHPEDKEIQTRDIFEGLHFTWKTEISQIGTLLDLNHGF